MSSKTRIWVLLTGVVCVVVLLLGVVGGLMPQLSTAGITLGMATDAETRNEALQTQIDELKRQEARIDDLADEVDELRRAIPDTAASADWIRELAEIETQSGATVSAFAVTTPEADDAAAAASTAEASEASEEASAPPTSGADPSMPDSSASGGVLTVPVVLTFTGSQEAVVEFVGLLQAGERLIVIRSLNLESSGEAWQGTARGVIYVSQS